MRKWFDFGGAPKGGAPPLGPLGSIGRRLLAVEGWQSRLVTTAGAPWDRATRPVTTGGAARDRWPRAVTTAGAAWDSHPQLVVQIGTADRGGCDCWCGLGPHRATAGADWDRIAQLLVQLET